jgi:hypothetical protein
MGGYRERLNPTFLRRDGSYQQEAEPMGKPYALYQGGIMAPGVSSAKGGFVNNIVVSRGDVRTPKSLCDSIVFANGDITVGHHLTGSVVVCDGDVTVEGGAGGLVVARGSIHVKGPVSDCILAAGGKIPNKVTKPRDFVVVIAQEPTPFGFVTFFELKTVGVDVAVTANEVRVRAVAGGKPFAKAGVRAGDVITAVNGKKPDSAESLRRLLRDVLAVADASVTLRRGDQTETVSVSLPD